jgi:hypothetical protein
MQPPRYTGDSPIAQLAPQPASARRSLPTYNSHRPTASAANASGFLLTALSNARPNLVAQHSSCLRASHKALTSFTSNLKLKAQWRVADDAIMCRELLVKFQFESRIY